MYPEHGCGRASRACGSVGPWLYMSSYGDLNGRAALPQEVLAQIVRNVGDTDFGMAAEVARHGASTEAPCSEGEQ